MSKKLVLLIAIMILAGCANPRAGGIVKEKRLIQPNQTITILWDVGALTNDPILNQRIMASPIFSKQYETCINAFYERTFSANGYHAKAIKVKKAELAAAPPDTTYVLALRSTEANFSRPAFGFSSLKVEGELYDKKSGRVLWETHNILFTKAQYNDTMIWHLVRALADDGFLNRKIEDVVDHQGRPSPPKGEYNECPQ